MFNLSDITLNTNFLKGYAQYIKNGKFKQAMLKQKLLEMEREKF